MAFQYDCYQGLRKRPMPSNRWERYMAVCKARFARIPALAHKGFETSASEGYKNHKFGLRLGPVMDLSAVAHDLAHVVEFGDKAFRSRTNWDGSLRFKVRRIFVYDRYCTDTTTGQASLREARTYGIQRRIEERLGIKKPMTKYAEGMLASLKWMHDSHHYMGSQRGRLVGVMLKAYESTTDEVIDQRLTDWFNSVHRRNLRIAREERKKALAIAST